MWGAGVPRTGWVKESDFFEPCREDWGIVGKVQEGFSSMVEYGEKSKEWGMD